MSEEFVLSGEAQAKLAQFKQVVVAHPHLLEVDRQISQAIMEKAGYSHITIYGPSGVGKSTMIRRVVERYQANAKPGTVPVVYVEARTPDNMAFSRVDFYRQVLAALDDHAEVRKIASNVSPGQEPKSRRNGANDWVMLRDAMEEALLTVRVQAVIIDEAQHLMKISSNERLLDQADWLKSMTNMIDTLHVLVGSYELLGFRNLSGQSARRGRDIHFPRYQFEQAHDQTDFQGILLFLLQRIPLDVPVESLMQQWPFFYERSIGCVGILKDWLIETTAVMLKNGETEVTRHALETTALNAAKCMRLVLEAKEGEREAIDNPETVAQLHQLLGMPASLHVDSTPTPVDEPPKRKRGQRTGNRVAKRDTVGES